MIKALLFDISGVLYVDRDPVPGAVEVLRSLQHSGLALRFVTNTSRKPRGQVFDELLRMGFPVQESQIFTAPRAVHHLILERSLRPYCLIHPDLETEFVDCDQTVPNAVVVADAAERFDYAHLNRAFQLLVAGAPLIAVGDNRYFSSGGALHLDAGPFVKALEYAAGVEAEVVGKPAAIFFRSVLASVGCAPEEALMIGDDALADVEGGLKAGLQACLVRTGKYRPGDEKRIALPGARLADSVVEAVAPFL
jgi:HAD superfamily hydrolase (TIGR01458 family)